MKIFEYYIHTMDEERYTYEIAQFGKRLKAIRDDRRKSQLQLEVDSGIDRADISKIENGHKNIEFYTIVRLAEALKVSVVELFTHPLPVENKESEKGRDV